MASERDGLLEQKEILVKKLNHFRKKLAITSDAAQEFNLQMQIEETEKKLEEVKAKIAQTVTPEHSVPIEPLVKTPIIQNDNKTRYDKFVDKLKNNRFAVIIIIVFIVIGAIGALVELIKNTRELTTPHQNKSETTTMQDTPNIQPNSITIDTPIIKKTNPTPLPPPKKETLIPKTISITLMVNAEFEDAEITVNGNRVIPSAGSTPTFKKLNIEYNVAGYEVVLKTANKTCTKQFSIAENELNNPITIPVSCTN